MENQQDLESVKSTFPNQDYLKSCDKCIHVGVCGAFRMFGSGIQQTQQTYDFIKIKPIILAQGCTEYKTPQ